jgi:hypothetical protein
MSKQKHISNDTAIKELQIIIDKLKSNEIGLLNFQTATGNGCVYLEVNFEACLYKEHILIMLYMMGDIFPRDSEIDHIDHNRQNNAWSNLRVVCRKVNSRNLSKHKTNKSGVTGVNWNKAKNKWRAYIMVNYKQVHLGLFSSFDDAVKARQEAEIKYEFHTNHGK